MHNGLRFLLIPLLLFFEHVGGSFSIAWVLSPWKGECEMEEHLAGSLHEFPEGERKFISTGNTEIGVFRIKGNFYAYENVCRHQGGPVCEGIVIGKVELLLKSDKSDLEERFSEDEIHLVCPWHSFEWNIATGECAVDAKLTLKSYPVVEREGNVYVIC
jgi:nitrite reductase (NADH) small subunit